MNGFVALRSALFRTARASSVSVVLGGAPAIPDVRAVRYDKSIEPGFDPTEDGSAFRRVRFEIEFGQLPTRPLKGDTINDGVTAWTVVEVEEKPEVGSWMIGVEDNG
jgi:hypothetical protein